MTYLIYGYIGSSIMVKHNYPVWQAYCIILVFCIIGIVYVFGSILTDYYKLEALIHRMGPVNGILYFLV